MNEIIRKIDELLEELPRCCNANYMKDGCVYKMKNLVEEVRQAIQAEQKKPKTNGDRIREMDNEELAEIIMCPHQLNGLDCIDNESGLRCFDCSLEWVRAEWVNKTVSENN